MSTKHRVTALVPFCDDHMACEVTFTFTSGRPAVMYLRNGDPGYPADPAEVEFVSARVEPGVTLSPVWQKRLDEWAAEWLADEGYDAACESAAEDAERDREYQLEMRADR